MSALRRQHVVFRRGVQPGSPPGTVRAPRGAPQPAIDAPVYAGTHLAVHRVHSAAEARALERPGSTLWIDVSGLGDAPIIEGFKAAFGLHGLALEDVGNLGQRPKFEDYEGALFVLARMIRCDADEVHDEQVGFFLGDTWLITFQEHGGDSFEPVRERLRGGRALLRGGGPGYLFVALLDAIVDGYFPVLERFSARLEQLEERVLADATPALLEDVYAVRRDILALRRAFWPLREITSGLQREPHERIPDSARHNLRDVGDHVVQAVDVVETFRELASSLVDVHLSMVGQRTNEIMRVLTVITAIFIPLSFLAAVYGMNFDVLPELRWRYGYLLFWLVCFAVGGGMCWAFARMGWLGLPGLSKRLRRSRAQAQSLIVEHRRD